MFMRMYTYICETRQSSLALRGEMTRETARSRCVKQRKREDMKTLKSKMVLISEEQSAGKRSYGKEGRKKSPFSSREIYSLGSSPRAVGKKQRMRRSQSSKFRVELMEFEVEKMKVEIRDSAESLMAANIEANQTEAELELLITSRNVLMDNLFEMKAAEALWMHMLGFL